MKAELLLRERQVVADAAFVEMVIWRVPKSVPGSKHEFKYRLAFVVDGVCVIRYDNETGKGDHKHLGLIESPYRFTTPEKLLASFWADVDQWRS